jgi:hypothetical protein
MGQLGLGLVGFLIVSWQVLVSDALPCSKSGYCSKGQTQPYVGDISTGKGPGEVWLHAQFLESTDFAMLLPAQGTGSVRRYGPGAIKGN